MKKHLAIYGSIALLLPVLYCLSIAPLAKLSLAGLLPAEVCRMNEPLLPLMNSCPRFGSAMIWYQQLWLGRPDTSGPRVALPPVGGSTRSQGK